MAFTLPWSVGAAVGTSEGNGIIASRIGLKIERVLPSLPLRVSENIFPNDPATAHHRLAGRKNYARFYFIGLSKRRRDDIFPANIGSVIGFFPSLEFLRLNNGPANLLKDAYGLPGVPNSNAPLSPLTSVQLAAMTKSGPEVRPLQNSISLPCCIDSTMSHRCGILGRFEGFLDENELPNEKASLNNSYEPQGRGEESTTVLREPVPERL